MGKRPYSSGGRIQRRKPKKRPVKIDQKVDERRELDELSAILFEHRLDTNAENWLLLPWRDGWNAIGLAIEIADLFEYSAPDLDEAIRWIKRIRVQAVVASDYLTADDHLICLRGRGIADVAARAAVRCLQMMIAKSDGGGQNYNLALEPIKYSITEEQILHWRGADAIGFDGWTAPVTPLAERHRQAFNIAWRKGLFHAAYALPPLPGTKR